MPALLPCRCCSVQFSFAYAACDRSRWRTTDLLWLLPLLLNLASRPTFLENPFVGLTENDSPSFAGAVASVQPATKLTSLPNFASSCHARDEFPTSLEFPIPRLAPRGRISDFYRTFIFLPGRKCSFRFLLGYQLKETVGVHDLWMQVDNLTKLWIMCFSYRTPKNTC